MTFFSQVKADDDSNDNDEEEEEEYTVPSVTQSVSEVVSTAPTTTTSSKQTIVTPAKTVYETQIQTVQVPDSDRDGIADSQDPNPNIAEIYIVKDENLNGIVDSLE